MMNINMMNREQFESGLEEVGCRHQAEDIIEKMKDRDGIRNFVRTLPY
ncbi:hypothetical protein [Bacillus nakamurai]|nr:hypothetical protein [Bacillus nakamurai]